MKKLYTILVALNTFIGSYAQCFQDISNGFAYSIAIKNNGTLWSWGFNQFGQLGDGTNSNKNVPTQVGANANWSKISAGVFSHTIALKSDGTLWGWGNNDFGQLGDGTNDNTNIPKQIGTETNWSAITAGYNFSIALKSDGTLWAWGVNSEGQLGDGTTVIFRNVPTQIGTTNNWSIISAGWYHVLAIKTDGTLWSWGWNNSGQLGNGNQTNSNQPLQIGTETNWSKIDGGGNFSLALKTNGTLWAWGNNNYAQLGDGTYTNRNIPVQIGTSSNWNTICAGGSHSVSIKSNGTLWAWGFNNFGELGDGTQLTRVIPTSIGFNTNWNKLDAGSVFTSALKNDDSLYTWGNNEDGQLGDSTYINKNIPTSIACTPLITTLFTNESNITIYPNPVTNTLNIQNSNNNIIEKIKIIDLSGKTVLEYKPISNQINIEKLQSGLYVIQITSEGKLSIQKLIKK
jgi:alpha-tubulin suppressor-like RCC1 family protein